MRKGLLGTAVVLVLGLTGCANSGGSSGASSNKPVVIGVSLSLDGDFSGDGKALQQGYDLWAADINARGGLLGRKVQFKYVNDASSTQQVVTNYQNLITRDKVDLTFGPFSSLLTGPAATVANRYHFAFLEPAGGGPKVFALHLPNLFFVQPAPGVKCGDTFVQYLQTLPQ